MTPAPPAALFAGLVDDAAVFPPGQAPLPRALAEHHEHRAAWYAAMVGPLLVPASGVGELVTLAGGTPVGVVVVARPGTPAADVSAALDATHGTALDVRGVEIGWQADWRSLPFADHPLVLEIPRGADRDRALADVRDGQQEGHAVQAKLRTGATPTWEWPDEHELARHITDVVQLGISTKLTGGLHHVVRGDHDGGPQHGLLDVLVAVDAAITDALAPDTDRLAEILAERDPAVLAAAVRTWDADRTDRVRRTLTAYGCCGVTDPITELAELDLVAGAA